MHKPFAIAVAVLVGLLPAYSHVCSAQQIAQAKTAGAQDSVAATAVAVDALYRDFLSRQHITGLVYGVVLGDKLIYGQGLGYADAEHKRPIDEHSLFRIASMSKNFTAIAILQLRDSGKLRLDDEVSRYLPEISTSMLPTRDSPPLTIRHLMTHGSGLPEDNPWGDRQLAMSDAAFTDLLGSGLSFSTTPDTHYEYSNLGFAMLGKIIERVSGLDFATYMDRYILTPLGMTHSVWEYTRANPSHLVTGFDGSGASEVPEHHGAFSAMGGLITSLEDFTRFASLHISAWPPRDDDDVGILKRSSLREMHQPLRLNRFVATGNCPFLTGYSFGLTWAQECDTPPYLTHNGGLPGFTSNWLFIPELQLAVIAFGNSKYAPITATNRAVAKLIIRQAGLKPEPLPVTPLLDQRRQQLLQYLFDWSGAQDSGVFAANFFRDLSVEQRNLQADQLRQSLGQLLETGPLQAENRLRGHFLIKGESHNMDVFFSLTPEPLPRIQTVETTLLDP